MIKTQWTMETILVVEPDSGKRIALALILRCFGYAVLESASRGDAWSVCREHQKAVHLVVMNAGEDGDSEFIARLQMVSPQIGALFLTDGSSDIPPGMGPPYSTSARGDWFACR